MITDDEEEKSVHLLVNSDFFPNSPSSIKRETKHETTTYAYPFVARFEHTPYIQQPPSKPLRNGSQLPNE